MSAYLHHNNIDALLWLQTSAEWAASYRQCYELARLRINDFMKTASLGGRYCITTDLDETLLDNSAYNEYLAVNGRNFDETGSWDRFCRAKVSLAMPGVVGFYSWLAQAWPQIRVFFVTSRLESLRAATSENLQQFSAVPAADCASTDAAMTTLFLQKFEVTLNDGTKGTDKYTQYRYIEEVRGYTTILRLGDNASDFHPDFGSSRSPGQRLANVEAHADAWGRTWIQMPNPVYGSFLLSLKNPNPPGGAITEDEGTSKGQIDLVVRSPRTVDVTPKVRFLDPWPG